jgi:hypothetical protein
MYKIISLDYLDNMDINIDLYNEFKSYFIVEEIFNEINHLNKVISVSLFCKNVNNTYPNQYPDPEYDENSKWYNMYYKSLLKFANDKRYILPDYKLRIYLENKLSHLKNNLINEFTEVYIMKNNSIGAQPGMLWRYITFDDKSVDVAFSLDIDETLEDNMKFINLFDKSDKTLGKIRGNDGAGIINKSMINSSINYTVMLGGRIGFRPKQSDISIINYIILFMLLINNRFYSDKKWAIDDSEELTIYNRPFNNLGICWGGNVYLYGFDEKIWKHVFYPYFSKKQELIWYYLSKLEELYNLPDDNPYKIDYDFITYYKNIILQV